jgi:phosphoglucomutase
MSESPHAGQPADPGMLVNVPRLITAYYTEAPDPAVVDQRVAFGTSGHRGSSLRQAFNEAHILATTQAICEYRASQGVDGPVYLGIDTHALSEPALASALEVLVGNGAEVMIAPDGGYTPTPVVSHAILTHNQARPDHRADGVVISPSHNPPEDGGFKYNPANGGPAGSDVTGWIQERANRILAGKLREVRRVPYAKARHADGVHEHDFLRAYVADLNAVIDLDVIHDAGIRIGVDPLGGASVAYWPAIGDRYRLDLTVVNTRVDPTFGFMTRDRDGKIRMDPSSPSAMAGFLASARNFDVGLANDTDADRHGIVTPEGLLNPNHFLAASISYLFPHRRDWPRAAAVGKTAVSSAIIDRVAADLGRSLYEVPVGFKWFVDGLLDGSLGFGGEESAGASFLRRDGTVWTTDKDGIILCLLAAEMTARTGRNPAELYAQLTERFGSPVYTRIDAPATPEQKAQLARLSPASVPAGEVAGHRIESMSTTALGNGAALGGLKVVTAKGWFAARPSGTEDVYKIYAESFVDQEHLARLVADARRLVDEALSTPAARR